MFFTSEALCVEDKDAKENSRLHPEVRLGLYARVMTVDPDNDPHWLLRSKLQGQVTSNGCERRNILLLNK